MRVETSTEQGVPDVYLCHEGTSVWIELKIKHGTQVLLRPTQYAWGMRHFKHGGRSLLLARDRQAILMWRFPSIEVEPKGKVLRVTNEPTMEFNMDNDRQSQLDSLKYR